VPEALAVAQQLPALAPGLCAPSEELWASHHAALASAWPWESAWLSETGQLGGEVTDAVRRAYADGGMQLSLKEEPDHVGIELAYLGHLCAAEAEALEDGQDAAPLQALAATFLQQHLGRWLAPWALSVRDGAAPAWAAVAELALELTESHARSLGAASGAWELAGTLPAPSELGLWGIVRTLTRPACSGWLLTPAALERMGEAASVPTGVIDRAGRLELALRSAGLAGTAPALLAALQRELGSWAEKLPGRAGPSRPGPG
jgi:hypothetical protein